MKMSQHAATISFMPMIRSRHENYTIHDGTSPATAARQRRTVVVPGSLFSLIDRALAVLWRAAANNQQPAAACPPPAMTS
jgi:hypothetical protein